jgi:hypothetical protein
VVVSYRLSEANFKIGLFYGLHLPSQCYRCLWCAKKRSHNNRVFGLCSSSGSLETLKKATFWKLDLLPSSGEGVGDTYLSHWTQESTCLPALHLKTATDPVSITLCSLVFLEYRRMDKVQKSSNSECYTPSLELFRIYKKRGDCTVLQWYLNRLISWRK